MLRAPRPRVPRTRPWRRRSAAAVGVARADEGSVRAAHAGADVDVRAHGPKGGDLTDRRGVLGLALKWFIVILVAIMVVVVALVAVHVRRSSAAEHRRRSRPGRAPPRAPRAPQALQSPLPRNWSRQVDGMSGKTYYVNHATGATSWERPAGRV